MNIMRKERRRRGLTQRELANCVGCSVGRVSDLEHDLDVGPWANWWAPAPLAICDELGIEVAAIQPPPTAAEFQRAHARAHRFREGAV